MAKETIGDPSLRPSCLHDGWGTWNDDFGQSKRKRTYRTTVVLGRL